MKATNFNIVLQAAALAAWIRIISTELALFSALHNQEVVVSLSKRVRWAWRESQKNPLACIQYYSCVWCNLWLDSTQIFCRSGSWSRLLEVLVGSLWLWLTSRLRLQHLPDLHFQLIDHFHSSFGTKQRNIISNKDDGWYQITRQNTEPRNSSRQRQQHRLCPSSVLPRNLSSSRHSPGKRLFLLKRLSVKI